MQPQRQPPVLVRFRPSFARIGGAAAAAQPGAELASAAGAAGAAKHKQLAVNFSGTWIKDKAKSESMSEAISLMGLSGLIRQAIKLIRGVKITQDGQQFTMAVFSVISWFKVSERYSLDGSASKCRRRDFRRGGHVGRAEAAAPDRLALRLSWAEPYGGEGVDTFSMPSPDVLHIDSSITVRGKTASYRSVYSRKKG